MNHSTNVFEFSATRNDLQKIDWAAFSQKELATTHGVLKSLLGILQKGLNHENICPDRFIKSKGISTSCTADCIYCPSNRTRLSNMPVVWQRTKEQESEKLARNFAQCCEKMRLRYMQAVDTAYATQLLSIKEQIDVLPDWHREMIMTNPLDELLQHTNDEIIRRGLVKQVRTSRDW
jgi:hypothetical protein